MQETRLRCWARSLKDRCFVVYLALRHPRTPWYAKAVGGLTLLYALSPIDLIPDPIPILGHLDDLILVPIGLWLTIRLVPADVWAECKAAARRRGGKKATPRDWRGAVLVFSLWLAGLALAAWWIWQTTS